MSLVLVEAFVEISDERAGEIVGVEVAQIVDALPHADFDDGKLQLVRHRQGDSALGRSVELGDDEGVELERAVELPRLLKPVLAGGGVDDENGVDGDARPLAHHRHDLLELAHEVGRGMQTPRRVDEDQIGPRGLGALDGVVAHAGRVASALARDHLDARAARPDLELLDGGGAEGVG